MSVFKWDNKKSAAAIALAEGFTVADAAKQVGKDERTVYRWKTDIEFSQEVDRLSLMVDIASRAERLRIAKRVVRKMADATDKDLLDWLKFAQSETDGIKLDLAALFDAATSVADGGQGGEAEGEGVGAQIIDASSTAPA